MKNKTYIWNRIAQKTLEIAYIAALCVFMVLFSMLLIVICIVYSLALYTICCLCFFRREGLSDVQKSGRRTANQ